MAIKVLSRLGHIGGPNLGPRQTADSPDVEVGAVYACWPPCRASEASAWAVPPSAIVDLEHWPRMLPAHEAPAASASLCWKSAVVVLLPWSWSAAACRGRVGSVHSSAALPGRTCLTLADSLLLGTVWGRQRGRCGQGSA